MTLDKERIKRKYRALRYANKAAIDFLRQMCFSFSLIKSEMISQSLAQTKPC